MSKCDLYSEVKKKTLREKKTGLQQRVTAYVGQTVRYLVSRIKEHQRDVNQVKSTSVIASIVETTTINLISANQKVNPTKNLKRRLFLEAYFIDAIENLINAQSFKICLKFTLSWYTFEIRAGS